MGTPRFWPSDNMRVSAFQAIKARGLQMTLDVKKAFRFHYQMMADKGLFKSPTSAELLKIGVDTSKWNDGAGILPNDIMWEKESQTLIKKGTQKQKTVDISELMIREDTGLVGPQPPMVKRGSLEAETIGKIVESGPRFSKKKNEKEQKPQFTGRKWKGEHWDSTTKRWELKDGCWFNPYSQNWEVGKPKLGMFFWIFEFTWDPSKFEHPVPLSGFHMDICNKMEKIKRGLIEVPRDHLKTTVFNSGHFQWLILEHPEFAKAGLLNISWDPGLAETTYLDITENLSENERILSFYGYVIDENRPKTQERLYFVYQPPGGKFGLKCTSFKSGSITGTHPYCVMLDDPQDEPLSEQFMKKFRRIITKKLIPAVGKNGKIFVTGTIKGYDTSNDGYLWLEKKQGWETFKYPAANDMPPMRDVIYEKRKRLVFEDDGTTVKTDVNGDPEYETYYYIEVKEREKYKTLYPERFQIEDLVAIRLEMQDEGKSDDDFWSEYFLKAVNPTGKFFNKQRIKSLPPPGFTSVQSFVEYLHEAGHKIFLWMDPGGITGHGLAIVVGTKWKGRYYFFDFIIIRAPLPKIAEVLARLIIQWGVNIWGCEGNYEQKERYAGTINDYLYKYMKENGWDNHYSSPLIKNNTSDKAQRIAAHLGIMIGLDGTDNQMFVNTDAQDYDAFNKQVTNFGQSANLSGDKKHEFDLLDGCASMNIFMFGFSSKPVAIKA